MLLKKKTWLPQGYLDKMKKYILFNVKGLNPEKFTAAVFKIEGTQNEVEAQHLNLKALASKHRGILAGQSTGKSGYLATMVIAYIRELIFTQNILGETMETAVPWSKIKLVKEEGHTLVKKLHAEYGLPGKPQHPEYQNISLRCMYVQYYSNEF